MKLSSVSVHSSNFFLPKAEGVWAVTIRARAQDLGGFDSDKVVVIKGRRLLIYAEDIVHGFSIA